MLSIDGNVASAVRSSEARTRGPYHLALWAMSIDARTPPSLSSIGFSFSTIFHLLRTDVHYVGRCPKKQSQFNVMLRMFAGMDDLVMSMVEGYDLSDDEIPGC